MERLRLTNHIVYDFIQVIDLLQDYQINNLRQLFASVFIGPGIVTDGDDNAFKTSFIKKDEDGYHFHVGNGIGMTANGDVLIWVGGEAVVTAPHDQTYFLCAKRIEASDTPWQMMPLSLGTTNVHFYDDWTFELVDKRGVADDHIILAKVDINGDTAEVDENYEPQRIMFRMLREDEMNELYSILRDHKLGGRDIMLRSNVPATPLNIRVAKVEYKKIEPTSIDPSISNQIPVKFKNGDESETVFVTIRWGWEEIGGSGSNNFFNAEGTTDDPLDVLANELVGHLLYLNGTDYRIIGNSATANGVTTLQCETLDGNPANLTGITAGPGNYAIIHPDADRYDVAAIQYTDSGLNTNRMNTSTISFASSPVPMTHIFELPIGERYIVKVKGYKGTEASLAGQSDVFTVKLDQIPADGVLTHTLTNHGSKIHIDGWASATGFEYGYTTDGTDVDFTNLDHHISTTNLRDIYLIFTESVDVKFAARPLQGGYIVGDPVQIEFKSGGMVPKKPINIRITDMEPVRPIEVPVNMQNKFGIGIGEGLFTNKVNVRFEWGYRSVSGGMGHNTIVAADLSGIGENELVDYLLYYNGDEYIIVSNTATDPGSGETEFEIRDLNGNDVDPTGIISESNPVIIHPDADRYEFEAIQYKNDDLPIRQKYFSGMSTVGFSPVEQSATMELEIGCRYKFFVTAVKGQYRSETAVMGSGSYEKYGTYHSYDEIFTVELPNIPDDGEVGAEATPYGFVGTINGWDSATGFEVGWTSDPSGVDFSNRNHSIKVIHGRKIEVVTPVSKEYFFAARPLQNGQVVGVKKQVSVVAGGGGNMPNEKLITGIVVDLYAWSGTVADSVQDGNRLIITLSGSPNLIVNKMQGRDFIDSSGQVYAIVENSENTVTIEQMDSAHPDIGSVDLSGTVYVGDTSSFTGAGTDNFQPSRPEQRMIYKHTFDNDVNITKIDFVCKRTSGTNSEPAVILLNQDGYMSDGKYLEVTTSGYFYSGVVMDLMILGSRGNRTLIVSGWDPSGVGNTKMLFGVLTIHYRDNVTPFTSDIGASTE